MHLRFMLVGIIFVACQIHADLITLYNHAHYPVYADIYYVKINAWGQSIGPATEQNLPLEIPAQASATLNRPGYAPFYNRELIFSAKKLDLLQTFDVKQYIKAAVHKAGWLQGSTFHFAEKDSILHCYSSIEYSIEKPILDAADKVFNVMLSTLQNSYSNHPYAKKIATVRYDLDISDEEKAAVANRTLKVNAALTNLLTTPIAKDKTPRIALCLSGGGIRAATCSYGLVAGLADIGMLDTVTYCSALSGSTWFLTDWILFGHLDQYHDHFCDAISSIKPFGIDAASDVLWPKYIFGQDTSIVDLYGIYLANTFFRQLKDDNTRQAVVFSSLGDYIKDGAFPFPLCTAVETTIDNNWVTFTPFEVSCDSLNFSIPTWSFGRRFSAGLSTDYAPEQSLGFFMGLWGSALSGSIQEMLEVSAGSLNPLLYNTLNKFIIEIGISDLRWAAIKIHNPLYGSVDSPYKMRNMPELIFTDAGYAYNIPITPIVKKERAVDIMIIMDASQNVHEGTPDFKKAVADFNNQSIPLPQIDFTQEIQQPVTIFRDTTNNNTPVIIYVIPCKETGYDSSFDPAKEFYTTYKTSDLSYDRTAVEKLTGLIRYSIANNKDRIIRAIQEVAEKKIEN